MTSETENERFNISVPIRPEQIRVGDIICFDYANPNEHPPSRVGIVHNFVGNDSNVTIWDFSLYDGPDYRSYNLTKLRNLGRLETRVSQLNLYTGPIPWYQRAIISFMRNFQR